MRPGIDPGLHRGVCPICGHEYLATFRRKDAVPDTEEHRECRRLKIMSPRELWQVIRALREELRDARPAAIALPIGVSRNPEEETLP